MSDAGPFTAEACMSNYRVVVTGVMSGRTVDEVVESLSRVSMKSPATLRALLDGRRVIVKRTSEVGKAARYRRVLTRMGCVCTVEADASAATETTAPAITMNLTATMDGRAPLPTTAREFVYAKAPTGWRRIAGWLRPNEWLLVVVLLFVLYYAYRSFSGR